eukprot:scaffold9816_cov99-Skeletonema_dohrnii-CCMP3373.AAC.6
MSAFKKGKVSKEDLAAALRAHKAALDATKSPQRAAAEEYRRKWSSAMNNFSLPTQTHPFSTRQDTPFLQSFFNLTNTADRALQKIKSIQLLNTLSSQN